MKFETTERELKMFFPSVQKRIPALFVIIAVSLITLVTACKKDKGHDPSPVNTPAKNIELSENLMIPDAIAVPANLPDGNTRVATFYAVGIQRYRAMPKVGGNPGEFEWVFVEPYADLFNATNQPVGTHSVGPTWQLVPSTADSIYGQAFTPAKTAPSPDAGTNIDWLLLQPKDGKAPTGIFKDVLYIQRIATKGGKAPATAPTVAGQMVDVQYTAIYRFTKKK